VTTAATAPSLAPRELLRTAHAQPAHDLAELPWLPVLTPDGRQELLGVRDLFQRSHELNDLAEPDPLTRAALRRWLGALTVELLTAAGRPDRAAWQARADANAGFTAAEVDALLAQTGEHLWLHHPRCPFLQDRRLIDTLTNPQLRPAGVLLPHIPGEGEAAWFRKSSDPHTYAPLPLDVAARALVIRWYYTLGGIAANVTTGPNTKTKGQAGSCFADGLATLTHAFRVSPDGLFVTLLRNLPRALIDSRHPGRPAWTTPSRPLGDVGDLHDYTATATATLLGPAADGAIATTVLAPIPADPTQVKAARDRIRDTDPHRIHVLRGRDRKPLRIEPAARRLSALDRLRRDALDDASAETSGPLNTTSLWLSTSPRGRHELLELLLAKKHGTGTNPKWTDTTTLALAADLLDRNQPLLDGLLTTCFDPTTGLQRRLKFAIHLALAERRPDGTEGPPARGSEAARRADALAGTATGIWLDRAELIVDQVLDGDLDELDGHGALRAAAVEAASTVLAPYAATVRYAASVIAASLFLIRRSS
jgi:hypothetical protein